MKGYHDSKTPVEIRDNWRTPQWLFDYYDRTYHFGLDLAASDTNHLCDVYMTEDSSGLELTVVNSWRAWNAVTNRAIWCNPPYSDIIPWVDACIALSQYVPVVMLIPSDTSVKWFAKAWENAAQVDFINGRIGFINESTGKPVSGNNKGSVVFHFRQFEPVRQVNLIDRNVMMCQTDTKLSEDAQQ